MADATVVHLGENSPEQVAYKLFIAIAHAENKHPTASKPWPDTDREWILNTYAKCLYVVQNPHIRGEA